MMGEEKIMMGSAHTVTAHAAGLIRDRIALGCVLLLFAILFVLPVILWLPMEVS